MDYAAAPDSLLETLFLHRQGRNPCRSGSSL